MADLKATSHFQSQSIKDKLVYKDECVKCFVDTFSDDGVHICLKSLTAFCKNHQSEHVAKTGSHHFMHFKQKKVPRVATDTKVEKITKLAIGVEGGIDGSKSHDIVNEIHYEYKGAGESPIKAEEVQKLMQSIADCDSAYKKAEVQAWELAIVPCEHTLTLDQSQAKIIAKKELAHCGLCDLDNNLWICLECGHLGCGRKFHDGTGGNGHALEHFEKTKHGLVVKSGTISAEGNASVFCYLCDSDVRDDDLPLHLANLGIQVNEMKKTEKTMAEIELEANLTLSLSKAYEAGKALVAVFGKRKTGLDNIGNSCYLASVIQCLANIPEFENRYFTLAQKHMSNCNLLAQDCFLCQTCKLFSGLASGDYSIKQVEEIEVPSTGEKKISEYQDGIRPYMFRQVVGKGHSEFSTHKQQDAMEYLIHFLNTLSKQESGARMSPLSSLFEFTIQNRSECTTCGGILLGEISSKFLTLPVPLPADLDNYGNSGKQEDMDYQATLDECLDLFVNSHKKTRMNCPGCNQVREFQKKQYLATFPKYLIIQVTNFTMNGWVPKKLHCEVITPSFDRIDLDKLKAPPLGPGAKILANVGEGMEEPAGPQIDEEALANLMVMGFHENRCKRALMETGNNVENALNHIMSTLDDPSQELPIEPKKKAGAAQASDTIEKIVNAAWPMAEMMGIEKRLVYVAAEFRNDPEGVVNYVFDHQAELEAIIAQREQATNSVHDLARFEDLQNAERTEFAASGAVVHLGRSVHVGHYIAYTRQEDGWIYFNDNKVAQAEQPQVGKSYILVLARKD